MENRDCQNCIHYEICREWYGHEDGMPNYAEDIECRHYRTNAEIGQGLLKMMDVCLIATNMDDEYSRGMRNGIMLCKSFIDDIEPDFE